jgi:hypothetical protein
LKKLIKISLVFLIGLSGCVTPEPEIRYMQSYNKPPGFQSYIQGANYKLWYNDKLYDKFIEIDKESYIWKEMQKSSPGFSLDRFFSDPKNGVMLYITKSHYKWNYKKYIEYLKNISYFILIESDKRMVNSKNAFYFQIRGTIDDNNVIINIYHINDVSDSFQLMISCPEHKYEEFKKDIQNALNGIEVY